MKVNGPKIADYRRKMGMTQDALADTVGVTRQAISLIEVGTTVDPAFGTVWKIAEALEVEVDMIYETEATA